MNIRAAAIIIKDHKLLLFYRIKNGEEYFVLPGGRQERNETNEQCVVREVKEELGLDIQIEKLMYKIENLGRLEYYYLVADFQGEPILGGEEKERMNEHDQYHIVWKDFAEFENLKNFLPRIIHEKLLAYLRKYNP